MREITEDHRFQMAFAVHAHYADKFRGPKIYDERELDDLYNTDEPPIHMVTVPSLYVNTSDFGRKGSGNVGGLFVHDDFRVGGDVRIVMLEPDEEPLDCSELEPKWRGYIKEKLEG